VLVTTGEILTVRLEAGSVSAEVFPSGRAESFVVEAGDFRVAVHGTIFRVAMTPSGIDVSVSEGNVLVGPRATPGTGRLLSSPADEHFDPPTEQHAAPARRTPAPPAAPAPVPSPAEADDPAPRAEQAPPKTPAPEAPTAAPQVPEPSHGAVDTAALHVIELTSACYRQRARPGANAGRPVQTTLTLRTQPDGSISSVTFQPALPRQVELCISDGVRSLRGPISGKGIEVSRSIVLGG
jgi:hypothetical protein